MASLLSRARWIFYGAAAAVLALVNIYLLTIHAHLWTSGKFIVGAFSGLLLALALALAGVFWGAGFYLRRDALLDRLLSAAFLVSLLWFFIPGRFSVE
ncbi:hypothetical protein [Acidovorax sp. NO-1]|uniref:hypothetical protein n=1 Tax=Acidovorax sp. NO-1 TaxID=512030 RepID=UPI0011121E43|nr:hypothetical protein [Acidovorax sp. NO-1]